jgi:far upstream element-binding protein
MNDTAHELVRNEDGTVSQIVEVAKHLVGKLIGKGGATISSLQQSTGCSIQVDHQSYGDHKNVTLKGPEDALNRAKEAIRQTLEAEPAGPAEGEVQLHVKCPPGLVGRIIGRGGETIRSLQAASGAHVVVDQNYPEGEERVINIKGPLDSADRAKKMCEELIKGEPGSAQAIIQKVRRDYKMLLDLGLCACSSSSAIAASVLQHPAM